MAFIPTPGAVRSSILYTCGGQEVINTVWASRDAQWTQVEREGLNDAIHAWWTTTGRQQFAVTTALTQITTVNQDSSSAPASTLIISPLEPGTSGNPALPNNAAMCATLRTDFRGRNYRGRMYLAGIPNSTSQNTIQWTTSGIAAMITALAALKTAIEALGAIWVVVSHFTNKQARAAGLKTPITAISIDGYIDSQRRRLGLRGV